MGLIKKLLGGMNENKKEFKEKFKHAQQELKIQQLLEERSKSPVQRELESNVKRENESEMKLLLEKIHQKERAENWKGKSILKGHKNILKEDFKILANGKLILHQKNIFLDNKTNNPITRKEMFWKW